jgi:hypothetical protein
VAVASDVLSERLTKRANYLVSRDMSATIKKVDRDIAVARLEVYRKWFAEHVM